MGPSAGTEVRTAIARAAQKTGVDFQYLLAQAKLESSLDPTARAGTSSAAGLYQFTNDTWLRTLDRHGSTHGLDWADAAIQGGRVRDPAWRAQVMALRFDPNASALMAAELARDNGAELTGVLGRQPDSAELYLAHFLGSGGAGKFLSTLASDPGRSAASLLPKAAAANRQIFYEPGGAPRTVAGVMELIRGKLSAAMEGEGGAWAVPESSAFPPASDWAAQSTVQSTGGPIAREFHAARLAASAPARTSMAETLRSTFAVSGPNGEASTPDFVRAAYGQLQRFGL
ncbi:MAG: transglycosylase SLT domain-containing protein [Novosphingobium sp.]|nr:transglycosylase SLT domain-containing protein [Novosphingobium sp.]MCP5401052.1 transglycosylase SLT domain-containing protein [Novosphingobium sp.]